VRANVRASADHLRHGSRLIEELVVAAESPSSAARMKASALRRVRDRSSPLLGWDPEAVASQAARQ